ncbi:MAG: ABC transporter permease [Phycisphaerales bacterium]|nr:ABC transporter permease [Phycisphaerales bacterium]
MNVILAICMKDIRLLLRDRVGFFFTFVFPLLIAVFFGSIFAGGGGGPSSIAVAIIDQDQTAGSRAFIKDLTDGGDLRVTPMPDVLAAERSVQGGEQAAYIVVPKGFGPARDAPFSGTPMTLQVVVDPSRKAAAPMLEGILTKYGFMQLQSAFSDPGKARTMAKESLEKIRNTPGMDPLRKMAFDRFFGNLDAMLATIPDQAAGGAAETDASAGKPSAAAPRAAFTPIKIESTTIVKKSRDMPPSAYAITFPQGVIWGVMGCALSFAIGLIIERSRGTMTRLRIAPIPAWALLAGKGLACFIVTVGVAIVLIAIAMAFFGVRPSDPLRLAMAIICTALCFVGIMNLLAALSPSERAASGLGWGVLLVLAMIGGAMVPVEFLPTWMAPLSSISPIRWALLAIEAGVWRELPMPKYLLSCGILLGVGAFGMLVGIRAFGMTESRM